MILCKPAKTICGHSMPAKTICGHIMPASVLLPDHFSIFNLSTKSTMLAHRPAPSPPPCPLIVHPRTPLLRSRPCALGCPSAIPDEGPQAGGGGRCVSPLRRVMSVV